MGAGGFFYKASATLPLIKIYQMSLLSAGSISLAVPLSFTQGTHRMHNIIAQ
jgi:hypothetical protein